MPDYRKSEIMKNRSTKQSKAKQSKAKQSKAKQKQNKTKRNKSNLANTIPTRGNGSNGSLLNGRRLFEPVRKDTWTKKVREIFPGRKGYEGEGEPRRSSSLSFKASKSLATVTSSLVSKTKSSSSVLRAPCRSSDIFVCSGRFL